jgi:hypothetical protein
VLGVWGIRSITPGNIFYITAIDPALRWSSFFCWAPSPCAPFFVLTRPIAVPTPRQADAGAEPG